MKNTIIVILVLVIIGLTGYFLTSDNSFTTQNGQDKNQNEIVGEYEFNDKINKDNESKKEVEFSREKIIGTSVEGRDIKAYEFTNGQKEIVFVAGLHGGYEWNTSLLAYELISYLKENPNTVPTGVKVTVIPTVNPDGLFDVIGKEGKFEKNDAPSESVDTTPGRFNANEVDLNRNFDCDWQSVGKWQNKEVDGGAIAFSEPESKAIKNYILTQNPEAVITWYSAAGGVFTSSCHNGVLEKTKTLTNTYANASGYPAYEEFNFYEITGDMVNWLAKKEIPAISVLLSNHQDIEWEKNKAGVEAILKQYK